MLNIKSLVKKPSTLGLIGVLLFLISGTVNAKTSRVAGEVVLYTFEEGTGTTVNDISGVGTPLHLTIPDESSISWIPGGGLSINDPTLIDSGIPATKLIDAVKISNEITIEAWIRSADIGQDGPARIVTLSEDTGNRNFTLGQWSTAYEVRLRTTATSNNGIPPLGSSSGSLTTDLTHVVYTRNVSGVAKIYINVIEDTSGTVGGYCSNWDASYLLALGNEFTTNRPWLGELYLVAVYDQALSQLEVEQNYLMGPSLDPCSSDLDCDDTNICTDDSCVAGRCVNQCNAVDSSDSCCSDPACVSEAVCEINLLGIRWGGNSSLVSFDPYSGAVTHVHAPLETGYDFIGLAYDPNRNKLYALTQGVENLYSIDPITLDISLIGHLNVNGAYPFRGVSGLAYDPITDTLYTVANNWDSDDPSGWGTLSTINLDTAELTTIGDVPNFITALSYNEKDGQLYGLIVSGSGAWDSPLKSRVIRINPNNTETTELFETPYHTILGFAMKPGENPEENIYYSWINSTSHFYGEVNLDTQTITQLGSDNVGVVSAMVYKDFYLAPFTDSDADGIPNEDDNCPESPNGPVGGTCTTGVTYKIGRPCMSDGDCGLDGFCSMNQEDTYPPGGDGIGDACFLCEADMNSDQNVDSNDNIMFNTDFGRNLYNNPCTSGNPCNGDFNCDQNVDAWDNIKFNEDFGRNIYNNPCPLGPTDPWCMYE